MKVKASVKKRCDQCKLIKRKRVLRLICKCGKGVKERQG